MEKWQVVLNKKVVIPPIIRDKAIALLKLLEVSEPVIKCKNFGELIKTNFATKAKRYHCHLKSGKPTYVAIWKVDKIQRIIEIEYIGTHEKAPY